ncbi:hypothetical protein CQ054_21510 [Ochrobactrum sp. MYb29]|nr:hypothetical protein CQ054_21510 [Ochrobactrum sp. MYb29]
MVNKKVSETNPKTQSSSGNRKFYEFGPDYTGGGKGHGLVFVNEEKLLTPPRRILKPVNGGFPVLIEKPHITFDPKKGNPPCDLEASLSGYWFISERLKEIFEKVDPDGFAFAECNYTLPDGSIGPKHYLCDVIRTLDALDLKRSKVKIKIQRDCSRNEENKIYSLSGGGSLVFKDVPEKIHVFLQDYLSADPICDSCLYEACRSLSDLTGLKFYDVANL